jgi:thioredoxin-dependent peroxiredoxin
MLLLYQKEALSPMKPAPDFKLPDQFNVIHSLKDYKGKWIVMYFYPKDDTSGCTIEACNFRDEREAIAEYGNAEVIGISKDSVVSHKKFVEKNNLNFTLLSDASHKVIEAYGAWGPKKLMGREYIGISRNTYIINPEGKIAKEYIDVNPKKHAAEIINDLKALQAK